MDADDKKQAIARAAEHVVQRSESVITEVIDRDEDKNPPLVERLTTGIGAALIFGATWLFLLFAVPVLAGWKSGNLVISWGYWSNGAAIIAVSSACYGVFAFLYPRRSLRYFGYLLSWLNPNVIRKK